MIVFDTVASLRASTTSDSYAFLEGYNAAGDNGGGDFIYDPADTSSPDDGAIVVVNASGHRYKRQWTGWFDFRWAGAIADGTGTGPDSNPAHFTGTDNAPALNRIAYIGRQASAAGKAFNLFVAPGQYNFDMANCGYLFLAGIKELHIQGHGAIFQNTYTGGDGNLRRPWSLSTVALTNQSGSTILGVGAGGLLSWLIDDTAVGDTQFKTQTHANAAAWKKGDPVLLTSLDLQYSGGFPVNPDQFEYHTVAADGDTSTGIVLLDSPIKYAHLTTFPDGGNSQPCGKARAWMLTAPANVVVDPMNAPSTYTITLPFDVKHVFEGLTINQAAVPFGTYMTTLGGDITFIDCTTIGISPTIAGSVTYHNHVITASSEPDKLVDKLVLDNVTATTSAVGFQSSSINRVDIINCRLKALDTGTAKYVTVTDCDIDLLGLANTFGMNRSTVINGGVVRAYAGGAPVGGLGSGQIDGVVVTYANGVITVPESSSVRAYWGLIPGMMICLQVGGTFAGTFPGDAGVGIVTKLEEVSGNILIHTTLPYTTLPAWTNGKVLTSGYGRLYCPTASGCDFIRNAAGASRKGLKFWEYWRGQFANFQTNTNYVTELVGTPAEIVINIRQPSATAGAKFVLTFYNMIKDDTFDDPQSLAISIDATARGRRSITLAGFTGQQAGDTVTFGTTSLAHLPPDRLSGSNIFYCVLSAPTAPTTTANSPVVDVEVQMDAGMFGDVLAHQKDSGGFGVTNVTGLLP